MNTHIIDCSAMMCFLFDDEQLPDSIRSAFSLFFENKLALKAPELLKIEVTNALRNAVLQKRLSEEVAHQLLQTFLLLPIIYEPVSFTSVLALSVKTRLSGYDACYLWLSQQYTAPLLTLDRKLKP